MPLGGILGPSGNNYNSKGEPTPLTVEFQAPVPVRTMTTKKLKLENRCNFFDICPLAMCFGELLARTCPALLCLNTYQTDTGCPRKA